MKITRLAAQARDKDRVNVFVDGEYSFSLSFYQISELGLKVGDDYSEEEVGKLKAESSFGKLYSRALEYCLMRAHSSKEIDDYLKRKTFSRRLPNGKVREGVSTDATARVKDKLVKNGYVDDQKFALFWVDNRNRRKGISRRKLVAELNSKGVDKAIIESVLNDSNRDDLIELKTIIDRKRSRYQDDQKLIAYLARQGFGYDDIKQALNDSND